MSVLRGLIALMRFRHWIKNVFVLAPLIFAGEFTNFAAIVNAMLAMMLFCVASSTVYIVNDVCDMENDRSHPVKSKQRPLAAGTVTAPQAIALLIPLYGVLVLGYFYIPLTVLVILAYVALNIAYSFFLKHQPVVDLFTIAIGFTLRIYAGALVLDVPLSSWMFITTLCLALFLASVKRRQELKSSGADSRMVLKYYTISLLERFAEMSAIAALMFFSLFVMSTRPEIAITIPLVLFGLFRYWFLVESADAGESPVDELLMDWQLLSTISLWAAICIWKIWEEGV